MQLCRPQKEELLFGRTYIFSSRQPPPERRIREYDRLSTSHSLRYLQQRRVVALAHYIKTTGRFLETKQEFGKEEDTGRAEAHND